MKLIKKKIIAREFLVLIACALVFGLAFISTIPYNYFVESRIGKLEMTSRCLSDSANNIQVLFSHKIDKQKIFFKISDTFSWHTKYHTYEELWTRLKELNDKDSLEYKWNNSWSDGFKKEIHDHLGFKSASDFKTYIEKNSLTVPEIEQRASAEHIMCKRDKNGELIQLEKNKLLNLSAKLDFSFVCLTVILILAFPFRYLLYAIKWSFKTLKQKEQ